ncbi:MAG: fibronectin type III domain-containing protein, partial [Actinobacteria bacterium]|nr:fibronectin type III domain-containing protein [Actinomycetota bacterium]
GISLVARGGGYGASTHNTTNYPAASGGSGGGGSGARQYYAGYGGLNGTGTQSSQTQTPLLSSIGGAQYGNDGAISGTAWFPGGGGGAGAAATQTNTVSHGGIGVEDNILGTSYYWGGGGGAAGHSSTAGNGGNGGGGGGSGWDGSRGAGGAGLNAGSAGQGGNYSRGGNAGANTGGGGGGGTHYNATNNGGDGGSGIVVLRYEALSVYVEANLTAPTSNGGSPITNYVYQYSADGSTWSSSVSSASSATTFNLFGVPTGSYTYFRFAAKTPAGTSSFTQYPSSILIAAPPTVPLSLVSTSGNGQVALTWSVPSSSGAASISDYVVEYSTDNSNWIAFSDGISTNTSATVTGLTNGTPYYFRISALNIAGTSPYLVSSSTTTPATTPSAPPSLTVSSVSAATIPTSGLVGYWSFDGSTSLGVNSVSGNTTLANGGSPTYTASGKNGGGLLLNGSSYLSGTVVNLPTGSTSYTIGGWIKNTTLGTQGIIGWGNWGSTNQTNALRTSNNSLYHYWWGNDVNPAMPSGQTLLNTWHHAIATYDG